MIRIIALILSGGILLTACGGPDEDENSSSVSSSSTSYSSSSTSFSIPDLSHPEVPGDAALGKTQYEQQCLLCHGEQGEGVLQFNSPALVGCSICDNPESLMDYIDTTMPPGGAAATQQCAGACAENVTAYIIKELNGVPDSSQCSSGDIAPSPSVFKRLSRLEYSNTLQTLLVLPQAPNVEAIPDDPSVYNFKTVASVQTVQASHLNGYISVATELAEALMNDAGRRSQVLGCDYNNPSCLPEFVSRFGRLAYRRPLTADESNRIADFAFQNSDSTADQFVLALQVLLSSPNFIYRVEVGNSPEGLSTLNAYELVSRLSFALWGQGPSEDLLDRAGRGELDTDQGLRNVAQDMLADDRAKQNLASFFEQWLATNLLHEPVETPQNWYGGILEDMRAETNQLLGEYVWQNKDFMGVFTENRTYLTSGLADYYGLPRPESATTAVNLPSTSPRAGTGILTHAANMFAKTDGDLVALRGNWLRSTFLCKELKLPNGVADIINGKFAGFSPTEIIAARNEDVACERCHAQIDPIGIAFSPYSRSGLYDHLVDVGDFPISPGFPDAEDSSVTSIQGIAQELAGMPEVGACLAERLFLYTRNHPAQSNDHCSITRANQDFHASGRHFTSLLLSLVEDPAFRVRAVPEANQLEQEAEPTNIALGKSVSTSSSQDGNPGLRITDDDISGASRWSAQYFPNQATIDLGSVHTLVQAEVFPYMDRAYQYTIEVSTNGSNYSRVVDRSGNTQGGNAISDLFAPTQGRYIRINVTGVSNDATEWVSLREVKIYGSAN